MNYGVHIKNLNKNMFYFFFYDSLYYIKYIHATYKEKSLRMVILFEIILRNIKLYRIS